MSPLSWHTKNKYIYMLLKASFLNDEENFKNNCFVLFMMDRSGDKPAKIHRATQHKSSAPKHSRYHHLPYHRIINIHATHYNDLHNFLIFFFSLVLSWPEISVHKIVENYTIFSVPSSFIHTNLQWKSFVMDFARHKLHNDTMFHFFWYCD